jgi:hypothetical protein
LSGCGVSARQLSGREQEALRAKSASIVLFRFAATSGGKPVNVFDGVSFPDIYITGGFTILAENIDTGDQVKIVRPHAPTAESAEAGWVYLLLERGRYHVRLHPGSPVSPVSGRYVVRVPAAGAVIYAGSLPITCSEGPGGLGRIFSDWRRRGPRCLSPGMVRDESEAAAEIARHSFAQYGPLATILMEYPR